MKWGDRARPVARLFPAAVVARFDQVADWLDGEVVTLVFGRGLDWPEHAIRIERWDVANVIACLGLSIGYAIYYGSWQAFVLAVLMYVFGWMAFRWFI